ncbi:MULTISPECIES: histone deacetylase family protein [Methanothermobacter]|uniref:Histone deacetylase family protein n=1 Tax=Methanothermobacter wolfeii TaxID=145261 RepID=A0A9E7RSM2_METWO|nr:histone deacetylase family protein [Methanothermobacter wolfeii]UXH31473.1 histone deacetylase family protein [Methanothermobacter wolfeii]
MKIIHSATYDLHNREDHVENRGRTRAIIDAIGASDLEVEFMEPRIAGIHEIQMVHSSRHVEYLEVFSGSGGGWLDYDTYMTPDTFNVARLAAGGAMVAAEESLNGGWSYSVARPPGHHACYDRSMGFCIFNNLAVAIEHCRQNHGVSGFLVLDFDVHHGNGTSSIFYHDPEVMYISIHQDPRTLFPGTGFVAETGEGAGEGFNLNIPVPPGSGNDEYIWILGEILPEVIRKIRPLMIFVSAGFDAHRSDPLASVEVDELFFSWIGWFLHRTGAPGAVVLEGGYDPVALGKSNVSFLRALEGEEPEGYSTDPQGVHEIFRELQDTFSPFFSF